MMLIPLRCLVYSVNYLVCLLITARKNQVGDIYSGINGLRYPTLFLGSIPLKS